MWLESLPPITDWLYQLGQVVKSFCLSFPFYKLEVKMPSPECCCDDLIMIIAKIHGTVTLCHAQL